MEDDRITLQENETENDVSFKNEEDNNSFEISEEAKQQSNKFFKFGSKPKKEKRKFESFEIVKTYTPKEKPRENNEFDKILEVSNNQTVDEETISVSSNTKKQQVKLKVRPQGKLLLIVISVIIILLSSLTIYNGVKISKLNRGIDNLNNQITIEDFKIDKAIKNLEKLNEDAKSDDQKIKLELDKATDIQEVTLYERNTKNEVKSVSNWFDKLCNFISKIFGG